MADLKDKLKKIGYGVFAEVHKNSLTVEIPGKKNKFIDIKPKKIIYNIKRNNVEKIVITDNESKHIYKSPSYAKKLVVCISLLTECRKINYPSNLIIFNDEGEGDVIAQIYKRFGGRVTENERNLVDLIAHCIDSSFSDDTDVIADQYGITDGYNLIKSVLLEV